MQILQALNAYGAIKDRVDPPMITAKDWENMCCNVIERCILRSTEEIPPMAWEETS